MPRKHKIDRPVTRLMFREGLFVDSRSFVSLPGDDGESHLFLYGKDFIEQKSKVFKRDNYCCVKCGQSHVLRLDAHHKTRKSNGGSDDMDNMDTICDSDHKDAHPEKRVRFGEGREAAKRDFSALYEGIK